MPLELGKKSTYVNQYDPTLLFPIPRKLNREKIGVKNHLPFLGCDVWHHFEVSWLNENGKPIVALAEIIFQCDAENIIESKSMKLYFNSFNNTKIKNVATLENIIKTDLEKNTHSTVLVSLILVKEFNAPMTMRFSGESIDEQDVACEDYTLRPDFLKTSDEIVSEVLCTDLLKSNCMVTGQPDWASVQIRYTGKKIDRAGLLKYIVSFRNTNEFSETAAERIFVDIMQYCKPEKLTIQLQVTRRGGIDIGVYRSTESVEKCRGYFRLCRQ